MPSSIEKFRYAPRQTEQEVLDEKINSIKEIIENSNKVIELNEIEKKNIMRWERRLFDKLEKIDQIKVKSIVFYPKYYLSAKGKKYFYARFGVKLESHKTIELIKELYLCRSNLNDKNEKPENIPDSEAHTNEKLILGLKRRIKPKDGELNINNKKCPQRMKIIIKPETLLSKISKLRKVKSGLMDSLLKEDNTKIFKSKKMILDIYQKKINQMINDLFDEAAAIKIMGEKIGNENLTEDEKRIIQQRDLFFGLNNPLKTLERIDSFKYGSIKEKNAQNNIKIKDELVNFAKSTDRKFIKSEVEKDTIFKERGIDPDLINQKNIKAEQFVKIAEEFMEKIGIKTEIDKDILEKLDINEPAPDGKWRVQLVKKRKSMRVSNKGKCVVLGDKNKSIYEVLVVLLGHEFTHMIETNNKEAIELNILKEYSGDRAALFHEAGAMMMQNIVSKEIFGVESLPHTHYLAAMKKKIAGGNYMECVKAFYDSCLKVSRKKLEKKSINKKQFLKECLDNIEFAVDRAKRLFRPSIVPLDGTNQYVTSSKDLLYLEQQKLTSELRKEKLEKYLLLGGINLDNLLILLKTGLLDDKKIIEPRIDLIREIWQKYKDKYEVK